MTLPIVKADFFADLSCPWCYVGWSALKRAAMMKREELTVAVAWRTFLLAPDLPPEGVDRQAFLASRYAPENIKAAHEYLEAAAAAAGVPLAINAAKVLPNTIDAHRVVHWASNYRLGEAMIDALFQAYFVEGRDLGATEVLVSAAEGIGLDPQEFRAHIVGDADRETVLKTYRAALQIGLRGVPAALFNRRAPIMGAHSAEDYAAELEIVSRA